MGKFIHLQTKKGVSPIIAYVLLIGIGLALATITFQLLKTYIPRETIQCPTSVSARIINSSCIKEDNKYKIEVLIQNNGLFKVSGFYSYYGNDLEKRIAEKNLAEHATETSEYTNMKKEGIFFNQNLNPNEKITLIFEIPETEGGEKIFFEFTPFQLEIIERKTQLATCAQSRFSQIINCD